MIGCLAQPCAALSSKNKLWISCSVFSTLAICFLLASTHKQQKHLTPVSSFENDPQGELVLAQVVFRHGGRTPLTNVYWPEQQWTACNAQHPGSINISLYDAEGSPDVPLLTDLETAPELPGGCRMGRLTDNGWQMAVNLGRQLRERYVQHYKLLPPNFDPATLQAQTTAYQRTYETLRGVLTGLYPAGASAASASASTGATAAATAVAGTAAAGTEGNNAVLPVAARWPEDEIMIGNNETCPALPALASVFQEEQDKRAADDTYTQHLMRLIRAAFQFPGDLPFLWNRLRDTLACLTADGKAIPFAKAAKRYFRVIDYIAVQRKLQLVAPDAGNCLGTGQQCQQVVKLSVGLLLNELLSNMDSSVPPPAAVGTAADIDAAGALVAPAAAIAAATNAAVPQHSITDAAAAAAPPAGSGISAAAGITNSAAMSEAVAAAYAVMATAAAAAAAATAAPVVGWESRPSMYANRARGVPPVTKLMAQQGHLSPSAATAAVIHRASLRSGSSSDRQHASDEPSATADERPAIARQQQHQQQNVGQKREQRLSGHQQRRLAAAAMTMSPEAAAMDDMQPWVLQQQQQLQQQKDQKLRRALPDHRQLLVGGATYPTAAPTQPQQLQQLPEWLQQIQQDFQVLAEAAATDAASEARAAAAAATKLPVAGLHRKVILYSAHDTTLMPLLTALGQLQHQWPPFASYLAFELWRLDDKQADKQVAKPAGQQGESRYYVRLVHDGRSLKLKVGEGQVHQVRPAAAAAAAETAETAKSDVLGGSGNGSGPGGTTALLLTDSGDRSTAAGGSSGSGRVAEKQEEGKPLVSLLEFKQHVLGQFAISRHAHALACRPPLPT